MDIKQGASFVIIFLVGLFLGFAFSSSTKEKKEIGQLSQKIADYETEIGDLNDQIGKLKIENKNLKEQQVSEVAEEEKEAEKPIVSSINLLDWSRDDIMKAISEINIKLENGKWFTYIYKEDGRYYDQVGPIFEHDPFHKIVFKNTGEEYTINSFRMYLLNPDKSKAKSIYDDFLGKVVKETQLDKNLTCFQEDGCAGIKIIKCSKIGQEYYSWFEGNYLFTSRNDNRETLEAFETFYCK